jgi:hypothetical protein
MASKKRSRAKGERAKRADPAMGRVPAFLSVVLHSVVNMTVIAITSGGVLLCLFASRPPWRSSSLLSRVSD